MQLKEVLDPSFFSDLQTQIRDSEFVYSEQNDSPLYDYLLVSIGQGAIKVIERTELDVVTHDHQLTPGQLDSLAPGMNVEFPSSKLDRGNVYGGTWTCMFQKDQEMPLCFKVEAESPTWHKSFINSLSPISHMINSLGIVLKRNWHLTATSDRNKLSEQGRDTPVIDMDLPIIVRKTASELGVTTVADFAHVDEDTMRSSLGTADAEELMDSLKLKLGSMGISMHR